ncbi:MAG: hypothetical protein OXL37_09770 [Chloroflexota bacterium]|nr:hypothetical protein [Chloroflexota bacterium]MDE2960677.1 hypothetical protein [Chloroflexota bacterium]
MIIGPSPAIKRGAMRLKCRRCGNEFDFSYEVARHNLHGHQIIYPKHCTDCFSALNLKEPVATFTYPGRGGRRICQEHNPNWPKALWSSQFWVYILSMTGPHGRVRTHLSNQDPRTHGKHPRLVWFCEAATREEATRIEAELKGVNEQNSDVIKEMALAFKNVALQLDFTTLQASSDTDRVRKSK